VQSIGETARADDAGATSGGKVARIEFRWIFRSADFADA
jgi:hypothetical protein